MPRRNPVGGAVPGACRAGGWGSWLRSGRKDGIDRGLSHGSLVILPRRNPVDGAVPGSCRAGGWGSWLRSGSEDGLDPGSGHRPPGFSPYRGHRKVRPRTRVDAGH